MGRVAQLCMSFLVMAATGRVGCTELGIITGGEKGTTVAPRAVLVSFERIPGN